MLAWLAANWATVLICLALAGIVAAIIVSMIRDKKKGKSSCGGACGGCALHDQCHKSK